MYAILLFLALGDSGAPAFGETRDEAGPVLPYEKAYDKAEADGSLFVLWVNQEPRGVFGCTAAGVEDYDQFGRQRGTRVEVWRFIAHGHRRREVVIEGRPSDEELAREVRKELAK